MSRYVLVAYVDAAAASPLTSSIRATGPPGESGSLAVRISTPSSVTNNVCSMMQVSPVSYEISLVEGAYRIEQFWCRPL